MQSEPPCMRKPGVISVSAIQRKPAILSEPNENRKPLPESELKVGHTHVCPEKGGLMNQDVLEKLDQAITKLNSMSEAAVYRTNWKSMTSAPRDGQNILGLKNGIMATVRWMPAEQYWTLCVPGTFTLYHDWDPTHWMPLPPLPKGGDSAV